jgi:hypothetical protein
MISVPSEVDVMLSGKMPVPGIRTSVMAGVDSAAGSLEQAAIPSQAIAVALTASERRRARE